MWSLVVHKMGVSAAPEARSPQLLPWVPDPRPPVLLVSLQLGCLDLGTYSFCSFTLLRATSEVSVLCNSSTVIRLPVTTQPSPGAWHSSFLFAARSHQRWHVSSSGHLSTFFFAKQCRRLPGCSRPRRQCSLSPHQEHAV